VIKIDKNTKGVAMFDRTQWFLAGMSIALSVQLSQPVAAVPGGKALQTAQTNSSEGALKAFNEALQLSEQKTADSKKSAIAKYEEALNLYRLAGNREMQAKIFHNMGNVYLDLEEKQKALEYYRQSFLLFEAMGDLNMGAIGLTSIAQIYSDLGENQKALEYYNQSLRLLRVIGHYYGEAGTLDSIGRVYSQMGERQKALEYYNQSLPLRRVARDRSGEAITLSNMAFVKRSLGNLTEAVNDIEASIKIIENFRSQRVSPDLGTSYFATVQDYYEFYIDLLMQLHEANPNSGYDIKASEARKRAINP
jgi:tetratricopeptide (TPR) repeat protein